jgi:predicted ATPase
MARLGDCSSQLTFDDDDLRSAAELCRKLDGNALAIELAATRVASSGWPPPTRAGRSLRSARRGSA